MTSLYQDSIIWVRQRSLLRRAVFSTPMRRWIVLSVSILFFIMIGLSTPALFSKEVSAATQKPTCKAGVHLISPSDNHFEMAADLINGPDREGEYCFVTLVATRKEMNTEYLQRVNNLAREHHIQIIYRIEEGFTANGTWLMPNEKTVQTFIDAMSEITLANKDVYVVLGNEPEHAAMCGGCTPESYVDWADKALDMLNAAPFNAIVMLAGHDVYSPQNPPDYYDAGIFHERMYKHKGEVLCKIDAGAFHSYPPGDFRGNGFGAGRYSPRGYEWELEIMKKFAPEGCKDHIENLPVFITETGYKVGQGGVDDQTAYEHMRGILEYYANDDQVVASTAFVFIACGEPFTPFAIAGCEGTDLNGVGQAIRDMPKIKGSVNHEFKAHTTLECPKDLVENLDVLCVFEAKNLGTDIWKGSDGDYELSLIGFDGKGFHGPRYSFSTLREVKPGETLKAQLRYNPGTKIGEHPVIIGLAKNGTFLQALTQAKLQAFEAPVLVVQSENILGAKTTADEESVQVQVFNENEKVIFRKKVAAVDGVLNVGKVGGVGFTGCYRVVLLVEGNLPVQKGCVPFDKGENIVEMPRLLPLDTDKDGKLSLSDILSKR